MSRYYIGADLGGTGIKAGLIDARGVIAARSKAATPVTEGAAGILRALKDVIRALLSEGADVGGIGVGSAGRIDAAEGIVRYATDNLPGWTGMRLAEALTAEFALPAAVENDANAAAVGEGWLGAAAGLGSFAMLTLGTGVGGAFLHRGAPVSGSQGAAGEFGHAVLYPGGLPCNCGQRGCAEQYLSGTALSRRAAEVFAGWDGRRLLEAFAAGHPLAAGAVEAYLDDLSYAVHNIQSYLDPAAVIIGGGVADSHSIWWEQWLSRLAALSPLSVKVLPARLGNEAGMLGAARLIMDREQGLECRFAGVPD
ncbi:ROK family protein [Paenibacillus typhae]|uniref:ROK family protein n=1 Tax=Paenibacillus typhae TaxID=1174501 RepID=UPI001C8DD484|nr:ROK family protein [Paenibacillus typhae]MBY0014362.1 ROK family protein [Paenibacillus typhae]